MAERKNIYTVGGTVQAGGGVYIQRAADTELLELCRKGDLSFILSSRQVGKSSLMVRTARQLGEENIRSVIIDLSAIGVNITADEWYLGILNEVSNTLDLETDIFSWWGQRAGLGSVQRLTSFFREVLLKEVEDRVVLFFDEIDSTLSIPFSDDFFASLRAIYNARSTTPEFNRLSFVLIGVATPSELISDSKRTPFNIGHRVDLNDFTLEEALPLAGNLDPQVLKWVFNWTGGHPYLTQRLCAHLSAIKTGIDETVVAEAVTQLFEGEQGRQDNNLQFVRDMLTKRVQNYRRVLNIYKKIRSGKKVMDDEQSIPKAQLKISGIVRRKQGQLFPRNRIYERTFDKAWVRESTRYPTSVYFVVFVSSILATVGCLAAGYLGYQEITKSTLERATPLVAEFELPEATVQTQLKSLAGLYELSDGYALQAYRLYHNLTTREQLDLFSEVSGWGVRKNQLFVAEKFYLIMDDTEDDNTVLSSISERLKDTKPELANEIDAWLTGRDAIKQGDFEKAVEILSDAIREKTGDLNPGLYFDRARAYVGIGVKYFPNALKDLQDVVLLSPRDTAKVRRLLDSDETIRQYWEAHQDDFDDLKKAIEVPEVLVPAGGFLMGSANNSTSAPARSDDETPIHAVYLDALYIDTYEVTNWMYIECVFDDVCRLPEQFSPFAELSSEDTYFGNPKYKNHPVILVNWFDAVTFCEWRGARLPTEAEWEKAARGTDGRTYPWGEVLDESLANFNYSGGFDTTPVGSYENGKSPYGAYDMAGNVWEWVSDWYDENYYKKSPLSNPTGPATGEYKIVRGGSWSGGDYQILGDIRTTERRTSYPSTYYYSHGFRCARDASE